jgi:hypothetical protein
MLTTIAWIGLGLAGFSAVAVAAVGLPLPHGRSVFSPAWRTSLARVSCRFCIRCSASAESASVAATSAVPKTAT